MTIYIDVLIILNIYVNYFLIKGTSKLSRAPSNNFRTILSSVIGSIFCLTILFPNLNPFLLLAIKLLAALIIVLIAFGFHNIRTYFKNTCLFYLINFIFAGVIYALYLTFKPSFVHMQNSYFYVDISLLTLVVSTIIAYVLISAVRHFFDKKELLSANYKLFITQNNHIIELEAFADTGNKLKDIFSGKSVILCNRKKLENVFKFPNKITAENVPKGFLILPYNTVNSEGYVLAFSPQKILLKKSDEKAVEISAMLGISDIFYTEHDAIFNPNLI